MTTKFNLPRDPSQSQSDYELTPVGIEDIDRALFKLFDDEIPFSYDHKGETRDIPVIFATGERAFILNRKEPLTDRSGALILPLISIMRNGLSQTPDMGMGIGPGTGRIILEKRVHSDTVGFLKEKNPDGLLHQKNVVGADKHIQPSRRDYQRNVPMGNNFLSIGKNNRITEILSIPSARYFTLKYEVTFWAQYLQQMNRMLEALMVSYTHNPGRSFKLETEKGYWFVAYVDADLNQDFNFDGMTDEERLVKASFGVTINGYLLNPMHSGIPNLVTRTLSSPRVSFDTTTAIPVSQATVNVPSANPDDYTFQDLEAEGTPMPGSGIGGAKNNVLSAEAAGRVSGQSSARGGGAVDNGSSANIGGKEPESKNAGISEIIRVERFYNPLKGEFETRPVKIKTKTSRHGETIISMLSIND